MSAASDELELARAGYEERRARHDASRSRLARWSALISNFRLLAFLLAAAGAIWGFSSAGNLRLAMILAGGASAVAFLALVIAHDRIITALRVAEQLRDINEEALRRLRRDWNGLPSPAAPAGEVAPLPANAGDLDLIGHGSLLHLLGTANTARGVSILTSWLLEPARPEEVTERQAAVAELSAALDWRQELERRGRALRARAPDPEPLICWAESTPWLEARALHIWLPRLLLAITHGSIALHAAGVLEQPFWLAAALVNLGYSALLARPLQAIFGRVSAGEGELRAYAEMLAQLSERDLQAERLKRLQQLAGAGGSPAAVHLRRLERLMGFVDVRRSGLLHLLLEAFFLWDAHLLFWLERWQRQVGPRIRGWLEALGELEALAALAGLHHDNPSWVFPRIEQPVNGGAVLRAQALGHPLLDPLQRVDNDLEIGPEGTFLLVTGSNMSGKSTLLRAAGVNVVLAQAGGPVCARSFTLPPLLLGTSFRVQDSLQAGVSLFMAELRRLKEVMDLASAARRQGDGRRLLYLLDEILQGTNIHERQIAVRRVLAHLLASGAIGAVSTHDLTLARADKLATACRPVHFVESFDEGPGGPRMTFDYRLRPGVATTVNALKLLRLVGLEELED